MVSDGSRPLDNCDLAVSGWAVATDTLRMCSQKVSLIHRVKNVKAVVLLGAVDQIFFQWGGEEYLRDKAFSEQDKNSETNTATVV